MIEWIEYINSIVKEFPSSNTRVSSVKLSKQGLFVREK